jgi:hypothetical protein
MEMVQSLWDGARRRYSVRYATASPFRAVFDGPVRHAVLMQVLPFGGSRQLSISISEPNAIMRGAGLHRLTCRAALDARNTIAGGVPVALSGWAWLSMAGMDWLGGWSTERPVVTRQGQPFDATLVLPLTDEQLAVVEQRRAGSDIRIQFDGNVVLGFDPAVVGGAENDRWPERSFQETVHIYSDTWVRLLSQVSAATSLAVVLPVPLDASAAARVGVHLREAVRKVNNGEFGDAVTEARKAIDAMDGKVPAWQAERQIAALKKEERTLGQRLAMLRHALHGLASPAAHGDDVAAEIKWDRETALAVIAGVAALAACRGQGVTGKAQ